MHHRLLYCQNWLFGKKNNTEYSSREFNKNGGVRSHGRVWKYKGEAFVEGKKMADAQWSATIVDRK